MATFPEHHNKIPLAVWPSAQTTAQYQRAGRYLSKSSKHPGKMLPDLARRIVEAYSSPGDLVVDPMAGIGTTIVEGAATDRRVIGVELEPTWAAIAERNLDHILDDEHRHLGEVRVGDARQLPLVLRDLSGQVDLIVTSPPYGCEVATVETHIDTGKVTRSDDGLNYSIDKANLGHARGAVYEAEMLAVYQACFEALRPGGFLVTVTKNMRSHGAMVDLLGTTVRLGHEAGFVYFQHVVSLLCGVRDGELIGRPSFFQQRQVRAARAKGDPVHLAAHEDVAVFQRNKTCRSSGEPRCLSNEPRCSASLSGPSTPKFNAKSGE